MQTVSFYDDSLTELSYIQEISSLGTLILSDPILLKHICLEIATGEKEINIEKEKAELKARADYLLEKTIDRIWQKLIESAGTDKIRIKGYGVLTKEKLKQILTDTGEAEKFLKIIGFRESGEKAKELARRVVEGKLSIKDGLKLLIDDIINWWEEVKNSETRASAITKLGLSLLFVHLLILLVIEVNTFALLIVSHLIVFLGIPSNSVVAYGLVILAVSFIAPIVEESYKLITANLKVGVVGILELPVREMLYYVAGMIAMGFNPIIAFLIRVPALIFHILTILRYHNLRTYIKIKSVKNANRILITNIVAHALSNLLGVISEFVDKTGDYVFNKLSFVEQIVRVLVYSVADFLVQYLGFNSDKILSTVQNLGRKILSRIKEKQISFDTPRFSVS